jgi:hypothetical protein
VIGQDDAPFQGAGVGKRRHTFVRRAGLRVPDDASRKHAFTCQAQQWVGKFVWKRRH